MSHWNYGKWEHGEYKVETEMKIEIVFNLKIAFIIQHTHINWHKTFTKCASE